MVSFFAEVKIISFWPETMEFWLKLRFVCDPFTHEAGICAFLLSLSYAFFDLFCRSYNAEIHELYIIIESGFFSNSFIYPQLEDAVKLKFASLALLEISFVLCPSLIA